MAVASMRAVHIGSTSTASGVVERGSTFGNGSSSLFGETLRCSRVGVPMRLQKPASELVSKGSYTWIRCQRLHWHVDKRASCRSFESRFSFFSFFFPLPSCLCSPFLLSLFCDFLETCGLNWSSCSAPPQVEMSVLHSVVCSRLREHILAYMRRVRFFVPLQARFSVSRTLYHVKHVNLAFSELFSRFVLCAWNSYLVVKKFQSIIKHSPTLFFSRFAVVWLNLANFHWSVF